MELWKKKSQYYDIPARTTGSGDYRNSSRKAGLFPGKNHTAWEVIAALSGRWLPWLRDLISGFRRNNTNRYRDV